MNFKKVLLISSLTFLSINMSNSSDVYSECKQAVNIDKKLFETAITVPVLDSFYCGNARRLVITEKYKAIQAKYDCFVSVISQVCNVSSKIIYSFIYIESQGINNLVSATGANGLMQITTSSATDILVRENINKRLTKGERIIIESCLGIGKANSIYKLNGLGKTLITRKELMIPELNILLGAIYLKQIIDQHTDKEGNTRFDKVAVRYNQGFYSYNLGYAMNGSAYNVMKTVNQEASSFILKLCGKNGLLDIALKS